MTYFGKIFSLSCWKCGSQTPSGPWMVYYWGEAKISENKHLEACITTWHWCNIQIYSSPSSNLLHHMDPLALLRTLLCVPWGPQGIAMRQGFVPIFFPPHSLQALGTGPRGGSLSLASLFMCTPTPKGHISKLSWEPYHYTQLQMQRHHGNYGFPQLSNHSARELVPSDVFL